MGFVCHERGSAIDVRNERRADGVGVDIGDVERAGAATALDECDNFFLLGGLAAKAVALLAADKGFVGLDNLAGAAERTFAGGLHGLADAVATEPRGFVADADHAADLMGGNALLGRAQAMIEQEPLVQRHLGALEHGPDRDRKSVVWGKGVT